MTAHAVRRPRAGLRRVRLAPGLRWLDRGSTAVCGAAIAILAVLLVATAAGYRPLIDYTGSMSPAIGAGDLLITRAEPATSMRIGQIVSFIDPGLDGKLVTHRVVALRASGRKIDVVTRGDANSAPETWSVARRASVGALDFTVPAIGRFIAWTPAPWARTTLLALAALVLSTAVLRRIWRA
jgi:signal peptidase I